MRAAAPTSDGAPADAPRGDAPRLLAAWHAHGRADLGAHLQTHGPLPLLNGRAAPRVIRAVSNAGLGGRGGGGFPAARKLAAHQKAGGGTVVVNVMEGEVASAKDAVLASFAPHLVLDGAHCVAAVTGARRVVVCVADDRDDIAEPLAWALAERGASVPGISAGGRATVELARPPARYVGGEESALVDWLARGPGVPQFRLDKAVPLTLGRRPVVVHNAETLAHIALLARVPEGTGPPPLTALVTVSGAVARPGVYEVAVGAPVGEVIGRAGPVAPISAVLVGGFGGSWIAPVDLDRAFSAEGLAPVGASPGAGVLYVLGGSACGIVETAAIASAMAAESAGQCGPCVYGLRALADDVEALATGRSDRTLLLRLDGRLRAVRGRGACGHPDGVARMVASALRVFADDVAAHASGLPCADSRAIRGTARVRLARRGDRDDGVAS